MTRLKKYSKKKNEKKILLILLCIITTISMVVSYAVYQKEDKVLFINAKVGEFETSSSDIELAMTLDGEDVDVPPSKGYYNVTVECDHADGRWDKEEWTAVIGNITSNRVKCNVNFETLETLASITKVGDYISMTPTSTSYTISTGLTGYTANQIINPSELNKWRVIKKNEDGTVEVISENASSTLVFFRNQTGYLNYIGSLNTIAAQYTNEKYVQGTRHIGYSNQIEKCTVLSVSACPPDTGYEVDKNLVQETLGTLVATNPNGTAVPYWLAARGGFDGYGGHGYNSLFITAAGNLSANHLFLAYQDGYTTVVEDKHSIRPILILKADIGIISGDGKSADTAYQLS